MKDQTTNPNKAAAEFWQGVYPDGWTAERVQAEMSDYHALLKYLPELLDHVTGGACAKPNTDPQVIKDLFDDYVQKQIDKAKEEGFDLIHHLRLQKAWSLRTFGPGERTSGVIDHIQKELEEIRANPSDVIEWIDVVLLAFDGAWRAGHTPVEIARAIAKKQSINESRNWPDWRTAAPGKAIEHIEQQSG